MSKDELLEECYHTLKKIAGVLATGHEYRTWASDCIETLKLHRCVEVTHETKE